jgi:hypothetical protein
MRLLKQASLLFCSACAYAFQPSASIAAMQLTALPATSVLSATAANSVVTASIEEVASVQANGITFKAFSSTTQHGAPTQRLLYLPGIEGLGLSAEAAQFPELSTTFELYCMQIDARDRSAANSHTHAANVHSHPHHNTLLLLLALRLCTHNNAHTYPHQKISLLTLLLCNHAS